MTCEAKVVWRVLFELVPLVLFTGGFLALAGYVTYSVGVWEPTAPFNDLDCPNFRATNSVVDSYLYFSNRTVADSEDDPSIATENCSSLYKRHFFPKTIPHAAKVGDLLLFIRVVSQNYEYFEEVTAITYSPIHFYCYPISNSSSPVFQANVRHISKCMFNILVPDGTFDVSTTRGLFDAYRACHWLAQNAAYTHAIIFQENDIPIQSMTKIGGMVMRLEDDSQIGERIYTAEQTFVLIEGNVGGGNSTATEEIELADDLMLWLQKRENPLVITKQLASILYDYIDTGLLDAMPIYPGVDDPFACISNKCPQGMENFHSISQSTDEYFVKVNPKFDFGFVQCTHEMVFNRTYNF